MLEHRVLVPSILCFVLLNGAERVAMPKVVLFVGTSLELWVVSDFTLLELLRSSLNAG
jgi:hypothetical protein